MCYTIAIIVFYKKFDLQAVIMDEKRRLIERQNKLAGEIWKKMKTKQSPGRSFKMLIGADVILIAVLAMNLYEYYLASKNPSLNFHKRLINSSDSLDEEEIDLE